LQLSRITSVIYHNATSAAEMTEYGYIQNTTKIISLNKQTLVHCFNT